MNKKYNLHIEAVTQANKAQIRLVDRISEEGSASPSAVRTLVDKFINDGITTAEVYLNSRGGSVFDATEIVNELHRFSTVTIIVGAVAASASTRILCDFPAKAFPTSQFMIHKPRMGAYGDEATIQNNLKLLSDATKEYRAAYAKRFQMTAEQVDAMWSNGDKWLTAKEALDLGLIQEIIQNKKQEMTAEDIAILEASGCPNIPKKKDMDINELRSALGLEATATEEQVLAAAKKAKAAADKTTRLEAEAKQKAQTKAEALVDKAIVEKKISADKKESMVALAIADYDNAKKMIDAMQVVPKLSSHLKGGKEPLQNRDDWDLDAWLEKDPEGLDALADTEPEKFKAINGI